MAVELAQVCPPATATTRRNLKQRRETAPMFFEELDAEKLDAAGAESPFGYA